MSNGPLKTGKEAEQRGRTEKAIDTRNVIGTWTGRGIRKVTASMVTIKIQATEKNVNKIELMTMNVIKADVDLKIMTVVIGIVFTIGKIMIVMNGIIVVMPMIIATLAAEIMIGKRT